MIFIIYIEGGTQHKTIDGTFQTATEVEEEIEAGAPIRCTRKIQWHEAELLEAAENYMKEHYPEGVENPLMADGLAEALHNAIQRMPKSDVEYAIKVRPKKLIAIASHSVPL